MSSLSISASTLDNSNIGSKSDEDYVPSNAEQITLAPPTQKRILRKLEEVDSTGICEVVERYDLSQAGAASITNAVFELAGWISPQHKGLVVTADYMGDKLSKNRKRTWQRDLERRSKNFDLIQCFPFDGKKNNTTAMIENLGGKNKTKRSTILMENVAIVEQPNMEPLGFVSSLSGSTAFICEKLWNFLNPDGKANFRNLIAIGAEGTNANTANNAGVIALFEARIGRNLHRLICLLHLIELCIKHLIFKIDGRSTSESKLSGHIGKKISCEGFILTNIAAFKSIRLCESIWNHRHDKLTWRSTIITGSGRSYLGRSLFGWNEI